MGLSIHAIISDHIISILESISQEKSNVNTKKRGNNLQNESSIKENDERFNRTHFFLKDIPTSLTYMDSFISIGTMYPLVQLNRSGDVSKILYLCVAGNVCINLNHLSRFQILVTSKSSNENLISIHLCFENKVNLKHTFLTDPFPGKDLNLTYRARMNTFNRSGKIS